MLCSNCFQDYDEGICPHCGWDDRGQKEAFPHALPPGSILNGKYILGRVLGQGGFGITYLAQDYHTRGKVALKEYFPENMASRTGALRVSPYSSQYQEDYVYGKNCFLEEAKTLAQFRDCPGIVQVYCYFEENGTAYFAMEYVEGEGLQSYLDKNGRVSPKRAMEILSPVMDALFMVHSKGVIHRDVTPDNIVLASDQSVKLLDFGAARVSVGSRTKSIDVVLKHGFAPREQYSRHGKQGPYTDVYAISATFYYAITLNIPPDSIDRTKEKDALIPPRALGIDISLRTQEALLTGLSIDPEDRFQNVAALKRALLSGFEEQTKEKVKKEVKEEAALDSKPQTKRTGWFSSLSLHKGH